MPEEQENFKRAVDEILKIIIFENWLRFYFIEETEEKGAEVLKIRLPDKALAKISELYPDCLPLASQLNNKPIDFESSRKAILMHVLDHMDGQKLPRGVADTVLSSSAFQTRLMLFNAWVQMHEDQLDMGFMEYGAWLDLFERWERTPGAKELLKKISQSKDAG